MAEHDLTPTNSATPPRCRRFSSISTKLRGLVAVMALSSLLLSVFAGFAVFKAERDAAIHAAAQTAHALASVVEREMAVRSALLTGLAASPSLRSGDLAAFWAEAKQVERNANDVIVLRDVGGNARLSTAVPWGAPPHRVSPFAGTASDHNVSDLLVATDGRGPIFAVRVPVVVAGERMFLHLQSNVAELQGVFKEQPLPEGWTGTVLDSRGYVVARTVDAARRIGQRISERTQSAVAASRYGIVEANNLDGEPVFGLFSKATGSDWLVIVSLSRTRLAEGAWAAFVTTLAMSLGFALVMLLLAQGITRSVLRPLRALSLQAQQLGAGHPVDERSTGIPEIDPVQSALARASEERQQTDERLRSEVEAAVGAAKAAQEMVARSQKLEALGRLTGGIAHDFNNLLQTMSTGLQLALRLSQDRRGTSALEACQRAVLRATQLTRQLLSLGRRQAGHEAVLDVEKELEDLGPLLRGAAGSAIELVFDVIQPLGTVKVDPVHLELALLNLVMNARDATSGQGRIVIEAAIHDKQEALPRGLAVGSYLALTVADEGEGMTAEQAARAFEPFFTTKEVGKGTGLGLAQVYAFATQAGGTVSLASEPSRGTRMTIWLPQSTQHADVAPTEAGSQSSTPAERCSGKVLLVEDDDLVREVTAQALTAHGFSVITAPTADAALEMLQADAEVDVVLSDIVMPGTRSGVDLARTLAVLRPALPVILASGHPVRIEEAPDVVFVPKPYDVDRVARKLASAMDAARAGADSEVATLDGLTRSAGNAR